jgi:cysteine desulfurase
MAHSSLRFGIGRFTTEAEIDYVVEKIIGTVNKLRDMRFVLIRLFVFPTLRFYRFVTSPLWEMVQEGIDINAINWSQH